MKSFFFFLLVLLEKIGVVWVYTSISMFVLKFIWGIIPPFNIPFGLLSAVVYLFIIKFIKRTL